VSLLDEVLDAHGGLEAWRSVASVEAELRSGGVALASRFAGRPFRNYRMSVATAEPQAVIEPYPRPGSRGVFEGDVVRIESDVGDTLAERRDPRRLFPGGRRRLWWDRLDALYFAGYALWNYFTTPLLLTRDGIELNEEGRTLRATFPEGFPTHSREQTFRVDEHGLIVRLDYTAEVFGAWARAKHICCDHREFDGLVLPTRRRVTPRGSPFPLLVRIDVDAVSVNRA
jgi:hypothetical protein